MTSEGRPTRRDAERNHETILTASIAVLAADPDASMQQIADASGTGRSTLYRHFPDRAALVAAIDARVVAEAEGIALARLRDAGDGVGDGGGAQDAVSALAGLAVELAGLGDRYRFLERNLPATGGKSSLPDVEAALEQFLAAAQRRGEIRRDLDPHWLLEVYTAVVMTAAGAPGVAQRGGAAMVTRTVESLLRPPA